MQSPPRLNEREEWLVSTDTGVRERARSKPEASQRARALVMAGCKEALVCRVHERLTASGVDVEVLVVE